MQWWFVKWYQKIMTIRRERSTAEVFWLLSEMTRFRIEILLVDKEFPLVHYKTVISRVTSTVSHQVNNTPDGCSSNFVQSGWITRRHLFILPICLLMVLFPIALKWFFAEIFSSVCSAPLSFSFVRFASDAWYFFPRGYKDLPVLELNKFNQIYILQRTLTFKDAKMTPLTL